MQTRNFPSKAKADAYVRKYLQVMVADPVAHSRVNYYSHGKLVAYICLYDIPDPSDTSKDIWRARQVTR